MPEAAKFKLKPDSQVIVMERIEQSTSLEPQVAIKLKGQEYTLEFNNFAARRILTATGINLLAGFSPTQLNDPNVRGSILYWGLKTHHPDITEEQADQLQTMRHMMYITAKLNEALKVFFPDYSDLIEDDIQEVREDIPLAHKPNGSATGLSVVE